LTWRRFKFAVRGIVLLCAIWGVGIEPRQLRQPQEELVSAAWKGQPLNILLASDLHVGSLYWNLDRLEALVETINAAAPDIVLLPGDFVVRNAVGSTPVDIEPVAQRLGRLRARHGVWATLGNHDWWYDGPRVRRALEDAGIRVLDNEWARVAAPGGDFLLVGVGDDTTGHANVARAFHGLPAGVPVMVMVHDPATYRELPGDIVAAVAGHTHAGQVRLPFFGALVVPGKAPRRWAYGWVRERGMPMYVTAGVGTSILPVRFNAPPELVHVRVSGGGTAHPDVQGRTQPP
jgi:predicted MPP superfamily phosphohydrolase